MSAYFRLLEHMTEDRWHLGDVQGASERSMLLNLSEVVAEHRVVVDIAQPGRALDYCETALGGVVTTAGLALEMKRLAGNDIQVIPASIGKMDDYAIVNALRVLDCLDESRSSFSMMDPVKHPDRVGDYSLIVKMKVDAGRIPDDCHIFRPGHHRIATIVSASMKHAMQRIGCDGAIFQAV